MGPTIRDGDIVTVAPVDLRTVRRGDVILYASERGITAHRVVEFRKGLSTFITQGDAPGSSREDVGTTAVLGRVESVERGGIRIPFSGPLGRHLALLLGFARKALARFPGEVAKKQG